MLLVLAGMALMGGGLDGPARGDLLGLAAAMLFSLWMVLVARLSRAVERPFAIAATQFAPAALLCTATGLATEPVSVAALIGAAPELAVLGLLSTGAGFTLQVIAQRATPVSDAAIVTSAESVFGATAAALVLGEALSAAAALGASMILAAVLLVQLRPGVPQPV